MRQSYWEFRGLGVEFVAAANNTPEENMALREKLDLPFMLLSDVDAEVARAYNAFHENEPRDRKIALGSMFLIDSDDNGRIIRFENVGPTARHRVPGSRLVEEILTMKGQTRQVVTVLVQTEAELERQIASRNDPPLGFFRKPPADQIGPGVLTEHEVLDQMVMGQYEEVHRLTREGWRLVAVTPETAQGETIGQRYVFERGTS